jgi:2-amino-4-hydroxy-6-hydroxymethyldihydropteridine diphosphokinase
MNSYNESRVYLGLGGNIGDVRATFDLALEEINSHPKISNLKISQFYQTAAVSDIPQADYLNGACCFDTALSPKELFLFLQEIETKLGKIPKEKNAPRKIDLDILFFGELLYSDGNLEIPHPRWKERLFVLIPLMDLTSNLAAGGDSFDLPALTKKVISNIKS